MGKHLRKNPGNSPQNQYLGLHGGLNGYELGNPKSTHFNPCQPTSADYSFTKYEATRVFFASSHSDPSATRGSLTTHAQFKELHHSKDATKRLKLDMMLKMRRCAKLLMLAKRRFPRRAFTPETRKMSSFSCSRM